MRNTFTVFFALVGISLMVVSQYLEELNYKRMMVQSEFSRKASRGPASIGPMERPEPAVDTQEKNFWGKGIVLINGKAYRATLLREAEKVTFGIDGYDWYEPSKHIGRIGNDFTSLVARFEGGQVLYLRYQEEFFPNGRKLQSFSGWLLSEESRDARVARVSFLDITVPGTEREPDLKDLAYFLPFGAD